jgi:hypothetical protein
MYEIRKINDHYYIFKRYLFFFWKAVPDAGFHYIPFVIGHDNIDVVKRILKKYYNYEKETKLDSLMNEEENNGSWLDDVFGNIEDETEEEINERKEAELIAECMTEFKLPKTNDYKKCGKCNGTGILNHYMHVSRGVCFHCGGMKVVLK